MASGRIAPDELRACISGVLRASGMPDGNADTVAEVLVATDLRGVRSHGTALLAGYVERLRDGRIDPRAEPVPVHQRGPLTVMDGGGCMGHLAGVVAMRHAVSLADAYGAGVVAVHGTNHCGAAGHYPRLALEHEMVGMIMTTAMPTMAPAGGRERVLGMNPIGVAIPAGDEPPVVLDTAFAAAARGRVVLAQQAGGTLPEGWARDRDGVPTTDPGAALGGLLEPIGGVKGAGLATVFGLLASAFAGAAFGPDLGDVEIGPVAGADGLLALVLDPGGFGPGPSEERRAFGARVAAGVRRLRRSAPAPDAEHVRLPGDRAAEQEAAARSEGILLPAATRRELVALCESLGVAAPVGVGPTSA